MSFWAQSGSVVTCARSIQLEEDMESRYEGYGINGAAVEE